MDLPIPGSPLTSVTDPGTKPPSSTRSNSLMPVGIADAAVCATFMMGSGSLVAFSERLTATVLDTSGASFPTTSSTRVFHAPQVAHWPFHLGCWAPQSEHT